MNRMLLLLCLALPVMSACKRPAEGEAPTSARDASMQPAAPTPAAPEPPAASPKPVQPILKVTTVDGEPYELAQHRGQWVVVNFWATWCAPCLKEMPELSALDAMHEHIQVIGLAYEEIDPVDMRAFLQKHPVVYPIAILDVYAPPADFATPRGLPMTYLVAPDGKVAKQFLGPVTALEIESAIAAAGGPAAAA